MRSRFRPPGFIKLPPGRLVAWLISSSIAIGAASAHAADASHPAVVELFQSQGCSSCPPANANVNALSQRADVLALSFAVTYWDRLGWKDTFAKPQFTERQWQYARAMRQQDVYTPQVVVNGRVAGVGADPGEIEGLISRADRGTTGPDGDNLRRICRNRSRARARASRRRLAGPLRSAHARGAGAARRKHRQDFAAQEHRPRNGSIGRVERAGRTVQPPRQRFWPALGNPRPGDRRRPDPRSDNAVIRRQGCFKPTKSLAAGESYRHLRRSRRNFKDAPNPGPRSQSRKAPL